MKYISILGLLFFIATALISTSCDKEALKIQQAYPFKITYLPIPTEIKENGTVEIRCQLQSEGNYENATYNIRFFQHKGKGQLFLEDMPLAVPNDLYPLTEKEFRLYYTAQSKGNHQFDIYVTDNFGQTEKVSFEFETNN